MFEKYTEEYFMEQAKEMGDALGVDTREGSLYMDAAAGHCMRAAKFYEDLRSAFNFLAADTCAGEVLDEWAKMWQITRKSATPAYYIPEFHGVAAADLVGERFMAGEHFFIMVEDGGKYYLQSETAGTSANYILAGTTVIPVRNMQGLVSAVMGELYAAGTDEEDDESLRDRWKAAMSEPAETGNQKQFKMWCEAYDGVGRAIIIPLGYGPGTVKALIIGAEGTAPPESLIERMQEEIDPGSGGIGEGKAPIGCKFYAVAAAEEKVNISFDIAIAAGYSADSAKESAKKRLSEYMKSIALNTPDNEDMKVLYVKVISILADTPGIKDFSNLTLNGVSANVTLSTGYVPIVGDLELRELEVTGYDGV